MKKSELGNNRPGIKAGSAKTTGQKNPPVSRNTVTNKDKSPFDLLSDRERIFVLEYLITFNATRAAIAHGSKPSSARQTGYRLLTKDYIRCALEFEQKKRAQALRADQARILEEEAIIAFFDPAEMFDSETGELVPFIKLPEHIRRNLQSMDMDKEVRTFPYGEGEQIVVTTRFKYKFNDKGRALEWLSKHLGLFEDRLKVEVDNFQDTVMDVMRELGPDVARVFIEKLKQRRSTA